ncbi:MAG: tRNA-binding protein [Methanobacterium sp. BRmetb2]|jgi:hypothetical protein|nr:MAG: tRNA-binding protein [Methanobacterium sp. BRmetb2]
MWDTSKDYRLLLCEKAVELFIKTIEGANFKGNWNKQNALKNAREMIPEIQSLNYSYLEPHDLINSPKIVVLEEKTEIIQESLGGKDWNRKFLEQVKRDEKEKVEESITKVKFFLNTFKNLKNRFKLGKINDPIIGIDIKTGKIMSVGKHPKTDTLMVCNVNIGDRAITVVTNDLSVKEGNKVAVSLLPPANFMGVSSEGMFIGVDSGILTEFQGEIGSMPKGIPLEALNETRNLIESFLK